jgi:hypothetical protein
MENGRRNLVLGGLVLGAFALSTQCGDDETPTGDESALVETTNTPTTRKTAGELDGGISRDEEPEEEQSRVLELEDAQQLLRLQARDAMAILDGYRYGDEDVHCDGPDGGILTVGDGNEKGIPTGDGEFVYLMAGGTGGTEENHGPRTQNQIVWELNTQVGAGEPVTSTIVLADFNHDMDCDGEGGVPVTMLTGPSGGAIHAGTFCIKAEIKAEGEYFSGLEDVRAKVLDQGNLSDVISGPMQSLCSSPSELVDFDEPWMDALMDVKAQMDESESGWPIDEYDVELANRMAAAGYGDEYRAYKARQAEEAAEFEVPEGLPDLSGMTDEEYDAYLQKELLRIQAEVLDGQQ